jgi:L,D-transpeptidase YbiS
MRRTEIAALNKKIDDKHAEIESLKNTFFKSQPQKSYLVVNTAINEVKLMNAGRLVHHGYCSTGSYILLKAKGERQWLFRTPKGPYRVTVKFVDPWWYKPDWAYVEEGLPIPSKYSRARYQGGVLGDYALGFGSGYMIHGTVYKRFLGLPVTHGCVRLDDEDMELVFKNLTHGSRIYIY